MSIMLWMSSTTKPSLIQRTTPPELNWVGSGVCQLGKNSSNLLTIAQLKTLILNSAKRLVIYQVSLTNISIFLMDIIGQHLNRSYKLANPGKCGDGFLIRGISLIGQLVSSSDPSQIDTHRLNLCARFFLGVFLSHLL